MSLYKQFATSEKHERDGVILDYGDGCKITIARAGGNNKRYIKALERMSRKHRRQIQLEILPDEVGRKILVEIYADTVILGWEGVTDREGNELPFTRDNCVKLLEDLPDLFADIQAQSNNLALFREEIEEADAKN